MAAVLMSWHVVNLCRDRCRLRVSELSLWNALDYTEGKKMCLKMLKILRNFCISHLCCLNRRPSTLAGH